MAPWRFDTGLDTVQKWTDECACEVTTLCGPAPTGVSATMAAFANVGKPAAPLPPLFRSAAR